MVDFSILKLAGKFLATIKLLFTGYIALVDIAIFVLKGDVKQLTAPW